MFRSAQAKFWILGLHVTLTSIDSNNYVPQNSRCFTAKSQTILFYSVCSGRYLFNTVQLIVCYQILQALGQVQSLRKLDPCRFLNESFAVEKNNRRPIDFSIQEIAFNWAGNVSLLSFGSKMNEKLLTEKNGLLLVRSAGFHFNSNVLRRCSLHCEHIVFLSPLSHSLSLSHTHTHAGTLMHALCLSRYASVGICFCERFILSKSIFF